MDAITILGTASAVANIIETVCSSIKLLRDLHDRWKGADLEVVNLITQLVALKAALAKISEWISSDLAYNIHYYQLVMDLKECIGCCKILVKAVEDQLTTLQCNEHQTLDLQSRWRVVFADKAGRDFQKYIKRQTSALTLLLVACNCKTASEQKTLLEDPIHRKVFDGIKDDSSSMVAIIDITSAQSRSTGDTERSSKMSLKFQFDAELLGSQVYQRAIRSLVRSARSREPIQKKSCRVLLLGARDSGKETMMRQMRLSNRNSHRVTEILCYKFNIISALVDLLRIALGSCEKAGLEIAEDVDEARIDLVLQQNLPIEQMGPELSAAIQYLGSQIDSVTRNCEKSQELPLLDCSTIYFLKQMQRITDPQYIPTAADILNLPSRYEYIWNEKIQETSVSMDNTIMQFIGCGSNFQSQVQDWIPKFQNLNAVVFVVDLCSYDQALPPNPNNYKLSKKYLHFYDLVDTGRSVYTRLIENIFLFDAVVNCRSYEHTTIFLFFTGFEQLKQTLDRSPLSSHFPDFQGGNNANAAFEYVLGMFSRLNNARLNVHSEAISMENSTDFDVASVLDTLAKGIFSNAEDSLSYSASRPCLPQRTGSATTMDPTQLGSSSVRIPAL